VPEMNNMVSPKAELKDQFICSCEETNTCRHDGGISRSCRWKRQLETIQEIARIAYWVLDINTGRMSWSRQVFTLMKQAAQSTPPTFDDLLSFYEPDDSQFFREALGRAVRYRERLEFEMRGPLCHGKQTRHRCTMIPDTDGKGKITAVLGYLQDITDTAPKGPDRTEPHQETALVGRQALSGLLPICSHCKKIRDDHGSWKQIETYITERSNLFFSHGICPECLTTHYSEYFPLNAPAKQDSDE